MSSQEYIQNDGDSPTQVDGATEHVLAPGPTGPNVHGPDATLSKSEGSRRRLSLVLLVVGVVMGLALGVYFHGPIARVLRLHDHHEGASAMGAAKQLWTCGMHPQVIQDKPGNCPICGMALEPVKADVGGQKVATAERKVKYWRDPMMSPPYISAQPGKSPMGMDLEPVYEDEVMAANAVQIDPVVVQNMGVRVAKVERGAVSRIARVVGFLQEAQPNAHDVSLRISGWVEKLQADTEGMRLKKGDPLFELYSPEIKVAIEELITARRSLSSLPAGADRLALDSARTLSDAAREKLLLWGIDGEEVDRLGGLDRAPRTVVFRSPIDGNLVEKMIVAGSMVKMGERALRIVDLRTLWLDTQVFAQDVPLVRIGGKVNASVESQVGRQFEGEVIFVHPRVDSTTRTATVRVALPNPDLTLRPGMYATAHITAELAKDALLMPREAVIDTGDRQVAFVSTGGGHFEPRRLKLGNSSTDGNVQVLEGLAPGEMVVTSGQFLLDAESRMREAIQKHLNEKLLRKPGQEKPPAAEPPVAAKGDAHAAHAGGSDDHAAHGAPKDIAPGSPEWNLAVDTVVGEYLKLAKRLGEVEKNKAPLDLAPLLKAAKVLSTSAGDDAQRSAARQIADAAARLAGLGLDDQRKQFKGVSDRVIALAERYTPSSAVGQRLYVLYCSMAKGFWLQDTHEMANPYYATGMKKCAEVKRTLPTVGRG